ncbi:MAG: helix-turn-helix transcriptional regulator [Caulobacter sp.]|nr:helix-turn-helix transcriptional regulator [Caulobacter sp.]
MTAMSVVEAPRGALPIPVALADVAAPTALSALSRLLAEAVAALDRDQDRVRCNLSRAVALLEGRQDPSPTVREGAGLAPWQAKRVTDHIDQRLDGIIRIGELAGIAKLSTSYFSRAFKATFGLSPQTYILTRRIAQVQRTMTTTREPLCAIADACGFSDQAHMSRVFRRITGATPNSWRRAQLA